MELDMEASVCCVCLNSAPILYKVIEKANDEIITPIYKLLICVPDINWLQIHQICSPCKDNLHETYDFREMCFKSEFSRCEIKTEDNKVEILDNDLKIEEKPLVENTRLPNLCKICSNFKDSLWQVSENDKEENLTSISKLNVLMKNIDWSDRFNICSLCEEKLIKAYSFYELCLKNQSVHAIETKQIKIQTIDNFEIEDSPTKIENRSKQQTNVHLNLFKCEQCCKEFKSKSRLQYHLARVHKIGIKETLRYECQHCSKRFLLLTNLKRHLREVHFNIRDFKCEQCSNEYKTRYMLEVHLARVHQVGIKETLKHKCSLCLKRFVSSSGLKKHLDQVHLNICDSQCEQCGKEFKSKIYLQYHLANVHKIGVEENQTHECHHCSKRFLLPSKLNVHLRTVHLNICDFKCEQCSKEFKSKIALQNHLALVHKVGVNETLKYKCHHCSKRFLIPSKLNVHLRTVHLNIRDFKCEQCSKALKSKRNLQNHLALVHKVGAEETL